MKESKKAALQAAHERQYMQRIKAKEERPRNQRDWDLISRYKARLKMKSEREKERGKENRVLWGARKILFCHLIKPVIIKLRVKACRLRVFQEKGNNILFFSG